MFRRVISTTQVSFVVTDEAHSVSKFGYDFRPSYMKIKGLVRFIAEHQTRPPVLGFTATAPTDVEADIVEGLEMKPDYCRVMADPVRPNLAYNVMRGNEWSNLYMVLRSFKPHEGRYIVYTGTRNLAEMLARDAEEDCECETACYHAGMTKAERTEVQERFKRGATPVIVATSAFGMGIDIPNIRGVVHFGIPGSVEDYCQAAGRAGRDGLRSDVTLIHNERGVSLCRFFLDMNNPPWHIYEGLWEWIHDEFTEGQAFKLSGTIIAQRLRLRGCDTSPTR